MIRKLIYKNKLKKARYNKETRFSTMTNSELLQLKSAYANARGNKEEQSKLIKSNELHDFLDELTKRKLVKEPGLFANIKALCRNKAKETAIKIAKKTPEWEKSINMAIDCLLSDDPANEQIIEFIKTHEDRRIYQIYFEDKAQKRSDYETMGKRAIRETIFMDYMRYKNAQEI